MRKIAFFLLLAVLIFAPVIGQSNVLAAGRSTAQITSSIDSNQRGFNAYSYLNRDDFIYFRDNGIKTVRVMFMDGDLLIANRFYNPANVSHKKIQPENLARLRSLVSLAREFEIKLIIDVHEVPGLKRWFLEPGENEDWRLWQNSITGVNYRNQLINLWRQLASELKNVPAETVVLELLNEPVVRRDPLNWADEIYGYVWTDLQDKLIKEIRRQDKVHTIAATPPYSWRPNSLDSWKPSLTVMRDTKTVVSVHAFFPINFTYQWDAWSGMKSYLAYPGVFSEQFYGESAWDIEKLREVLKPVETFSAKYPKPVYISEFGVTRTAPGANLWLSDMISVMNSTKGVWGWSAHVWGEKEFALRKGISYDPALGGMYDFASSQDQLNTVLAGIKQ